MFRRSPIAIILCVASWFVLSAGLVSASPSYTVTALFSSSPGYYANDYAINNSGEVVGNANANTGDLWRAGSLTPIGPSSGFWGCGASSINASGQVAVTCYATANAERGFLWSNGSYTQNLGTPNTLYNYGVVAVGVNDNGQVVGHSNSADGHYRAFLWSSGTMTDLGTLGGPSSDARAINNSGKIVGTGFTSDLRCFATSWCGGSITNLGTLPGDIASNAFDVNAAGQVVGSSRISNAYWTAGHAVLWSDSGSITDLGVLPGYTYFSTAYGINVSGQIVGSSRDSSQNEHAFVYDNGAMVDLNSLIDPASGWTLVYANDINDSGQIVGYGTLGGNGYAFLLTPIPEPSTLALLGIGAISLLACVWRRRRRLHNLRSMILAAMLVVLPLMMASVTQAQVSNVFNMGGTRDPTTGTWTGQASLEFVPVGDPGNAADTTGYGSVPYTYQMGKYDVTVAQYVQFLNSVAKTDTYSLYNNYMVPQPGAPVYGTHMPTVGITQSGTSGSYSYSVTGDYAQAANCPIFCVTWGDAARFCNWLQNGQPIGSEGDGTTETGAYTLSGAVTNSALMAITRSTVAKYVIPTEDEWYKAAYYKGGGTDVGYWTYQTQSDIPPSNISSSTGTNNANYYAGSYTDPTNRLTPVGLFSSSPGPYGTYDMGGDVFQWNEAAYSSSLRVLRGSSWASLPYGLASSFRFDDDPVMAACGVGFRVAIVPEPGSIVLVLAGAACLLAFAWRRQQV
jgi:probable HAF family extracellular repeat protein